MEKEGHALLPLDLMAGSLARVFDVLWVIASAFIVFYLRFDHFNMPIPFQTLAVLGALDIVLFCSTFNVYASWRGRQKAGLVSRMVSAHLFASIFLLGFLVFSQQAEFFSRLWLAGWMVLNLLGAIVFRILVYWTLNRMRARGLNTKRVIVVGNSCSVRKVIYCLKSKPWLGLDVVWTYLLDTSDDRDISDLAQRVIKMQVSDVWVCLPLKEEETVNKVLYELRHSTANIRYFPDLSGFRLLNHKTTEIAGMPALDLSCTPMDGGNRIIKNLEDRILGLMIFLLISPLLLLIALGVKLSSPGPVIFKQYRHGMGGRRINIYKFRSMKLHQEPQGQVTQARLQDERITAFGRFLRKTSLDELPQFFNVIQGKMSIVGPRPHALAHNEHYKEIIESYMKRHKVKPGITGWAQVNGLRGETDTVEKMRKRVEYDLFYIENWSLSFDLKIIFMTLLRGFIHKNAY